MTRNGLHQIGEVAKRVGLSLRTVRYYEEAALVKPTKRTRGGFRLYGAEQVERLELIKQMQPLGFTLKEMKRLLRIRDQLDGLEPGDPDYAQAHERLSAFADAANDKCRELRSKLEAAEGFSAELQADLRKRRPKSQANRS